MPNAQTAVLVDAVHRNLRGKPVAVASIPVRRHGPATRRLSHEADARHDISINRLI
jgi:hypothetical protein